MFNNVGWKYLNDKVGGQVSSVVGYPDDIVINYVPNGGNEPKRINLFFGDSDVLTFGYFPYTLEDDVKFYSTRGDSHMSLSREPAMEIVGHANNYLDDRQFEEVVRDTYNRCWCAGRYWPKWGILCMWSEQSSNTMKKIVKDVRINPNTTYLVDDENTCETVSEYIATGHRSWFDDRYPCDETNLPDDIKAIIKNMNVKTSNSFVTQKERSGWKTMALRNNTIYQESIKRDTKLNEMDEERNTIYERFRNDRNFRYRMVYELVKRGYVIHGTKSEFDQFDVSKIEGGLRGKYGYGAYFTDAAYKCEEYGNNFVFCNINDFNIIDLEDNIDSNSNPFMTKSGTEGIIRMANEYIQKNGNLRYGELNYYLSNNARGWEDASQDVSEMYLSLGYDGFKCGSEIVLFNFPKLNRNIVKDKTSLLYDVFQKMQSSNESYLRSSLNETLTKSYHGRLGNEFGNYQHAKNNSFWDKIEELGFKHRLTKSEYDGDWNWNLRLYIINRNQLNKDVLNKLQQYLNFYNFVIVNKIEGEDTIQYWFETKYGDKISTEYHNVWYHATPSNKVDKILKTGLTPRDEGKRGDYRTPRIYLLPWYDDFFFESLYNKDGEMSNDFDYTVLKIDLSKMSNPPKLYRDEMAKSHNGVYTYDNIPPQCISVPPQKKKIEEEERQRVFKIVSDGIASKYNLKMNNGILSGIFNVPNKGYSVEVKFTFTYKGYTKKFNGDWNVDGVKTRFIQNGETRKNLRTFQFGKGYTGPNEKSNVSKPIENVVKDIDKWLSNEFKVTTPKNKQVENFVRECIREAISEMIDEVRYIDTRDEKYNGKTHKNHWTDIYNQEPITDNSRIRVFHGCELETACEIAINGTSGKTYHPRQYSYESGMNPLGIFVTTDFETAKKFGVSNTGMAIIEFTAKGSDLESPVWNGQGSYFGQGSMPMPFKDKEERDAQKMQYRQDALNTKDDYYYDDKHKRRDISMDHVRKSDKPEMADRIFNNAEHQALFMGDLNPNMIKRIWVKLPQADGYTHSYDSYQPMSVKQFLRQFKDKEWQDGYDRNYNPQYRKIRKEKLFYPNEDVKSFDDVIDRIWQNEKQFYNSREEVEKMLNDWGMLQTPPSDNAYDIIKNELWPKQIIQLYGKDYFNNNFNRLGQ